MARQHEQRWQRLVEDVNDGKGSLDRERRAWARDPALAPDYARTLVTKLQGDAASITDADVRVLSDEGFDEDQIFEFLVSGAVHAGTRRLNAGLSAIRSGTSTRDRS